MAKRMLIDAQHPEETRVVIADENQIYDFDFVSTAKKQLKGNIYLAKITRVEPSLQAAFVEYGGGKQGFLPFSEIHADYYQIPISDRKRLMEEAQAEEEADESNDADQASAQTSASDTDASTSDGPATELAASDATGFSQGTDQNHSGNKDEATDHPAYLMQGAIDISTSEYVEMPENAEDNLPISQALAHTESSAGGNLDHGEPMMASVLPIAIDEQPSDMAGDYQTSERSNSEGQQNDAPASENQPSEGVETLSSEEEDYQSRPKKNVFLKRYKIQEVIRRGQIVLVQVIKEERGNKGCSLTTYLSLAGRYCVLMPNSPKDGGISRKIANAEDRKRLKAISTELRLAQGMSVIVRTAGMDRTRAEIKRDYDYLVKLWNQIREDTLKSNAPALIYEESDIIKRAIRDQYSSDIDELIVEGDEGYHAAKEFMKLLLPSHTPKIKHYKEATPLFYALNVEEQLLSMHDPVVKLKSGGYIVINPTEALISIDVNSGRATGERNIEETAIKTNVEAAAEVARQLRLRDLAGLIVIDFIDMMESRNRRAVEKTLKDSLKADRAKIQLGRISPFGLLEMSRQRLRPSISESNMVQCQHCIGRGVIRSNESMSIQMVRAIEKEASSGTWSGLRVIAPQEIALHLLNSKRDVLRAIEQRHNLTIQVLIDADMASSEFNLEKMRRSQGERSEGGERERERRPRRPERNDRNERPERQERSYRDRDRNHAAASTHETASNDNADAASEGSIEMVESPRDGAFGGERERKNRNRRRGGRNRNRDRDHNRGEQPPQAVSDGVIDMESTDQAAFSPAEAGLPDDAVAQERPPQDHSQRPPRTRGGRGRRRWRDRDDREPRDGQTVAPVAVAGEPQANTYEHAPAVVTDGNTLPAFATEERAPVEPVASRSFEPYVSASAEPVAANGGEGGSKKGWWQKMIELDD